MKRGVNYMFVVIASTLLILAGSDFLKTGFEAISIKKTLPNLTNYKPSTFKRSNVDSIKLGLAYVMKNFDTLTAKQVEKVYRLETNHFRQGFINTNCAGMHPWGEQYPFGWNSCKPLWDSLPWAAPIGFTYMTEGGTGKKRKYLVFRNYKAGALTLAYILKKRGNNPGRYFSNNPAARARYNSSIDRIRAKYVESML